MAEKKKHLIKVQDQLVPVNEEVYLTYYRMKRREIYLEERDTANGVFYYSALDAEGTNGEDVIPDRSSPPVEDLVMDKLITEKLHRCLAQLAKEEQELIFTLFFQNFFLTVIHRNVRSFWAGGRHEELERYSQNAGTGQACAVAARTGTILYHTLPRSA